MRRLLIALTAVATLASLAACGSSPSGGGSDSQAATVKSYGFSVWVGTAMVLAGVFVNLTSALRHTRIITGLNRGDDVIGRPSYTAVAVGR